jgi:hypothetical protein
MGVKDQFSHPCGKRYEIIPPLPSKINFPLITLENKIF